MELFPPPIVEEPLLEGECKAEPLTEPLIDPRTVPLIEGLFDIGFEPIIERFIVSGLEALILLEFCLLVKVFTNEFFNIVFFGLTRVLFLLMGVSAREFILGKLISHGINILN